MGGDDDDGNIPLILYNSKTRRSDVSDMDEATSPPRLRRRRSQGEKQGRANKQKSRTAGASGLEQQNPTRFRSIKYTAYTFTCNTRWALLGLSSSLTWLPQVTTIVRPFPHVPYEAMM